MGVKGLLKQGDKVPHRVLVKTEENSEGTQDRVARSKGPEWDLSRDEQIRGRTILLGSNAGL